MIDYSVPQVNFYSMLSGLGDTIQKNAALRQQQDVNAARSQAVSKFSQLDPNSPDYGRQVQTIAGQLHPDDSEGAFKFIGLAHQAQRDAQTDKHQAFSENMATRADKRASAADSRAAYEFEHTPDQYSTGPDGKIVDRYAEAASAAQNAKPVPFETLGGTKFMVRQPNGSYGVVDPTTIGQRAPPVPSSPTVVGDAEGVARGLYDAPAAPGQRPPVAPAGQPPAPGAAPSALPAAPVDLTAVDPATGRRENWLKSQSPDVQAYIKKIADYEIDPRTTSIKGGHREQVLSAVAQYDPTYDQNTFGSRAKAMRDFATGTQGNAVRSFDVAIDHLDTLQKYADALKSGDLRLINSLRNRWLTETGSPLPTNVQAVAPIVGAEVSKAIIGSNNALADREELRKPLDKANSPEQISGAIQGYKTLMAGQLKGLKKQYEDTTGKKDFNNRVREGTRNALLGGDGPQSETDASKPNVTTTGVKWSIQ